MEKKRKLATMQKRKEKRSSTLPGNPWGRRLTNKRRECTDLYITRKKKWEKKESGSQKLGLGGGRGKFEAGGKGKVCPFQKKEKPYSKEVQVHPFRPASRKKM